MAARTTAKPSQLDALAAEFAPEEHKTRSQGGTTLTYLSIDATIKRLNEVLGAAWSTKASTDLIPLDGGKYLAKCELTLSGLIDGTQRDAYGVGAMVNGDPDMAAKTALAEAIKKAGHQLGIGLYLWDPVARESVGKRMKLAGASQATLKNELFAIAKRELGKDKPSAKEIAAHFGMDVADLQEPDKIREALEARA